MTENKKDEILEKVIKNNFAPKSLRTIMVAYKDLSTHEYEGLK